VIGALLAGAAAIGPANANVVATTTAPINIFIPGSFPLPALLRSTAPHHARQQNSVIASSRIMQAHDREPA
jgi:hypothetical protein